MDITMPMRLPQGLTAVWHTGGAGRSLAIKAHRGYINTYKLSSDAMPLVKLGTGPASFQRRWGGPFYLDNIPYGRKEAEEALDRNTSSQLSGELEDGMVTDTSAKHLKCAQAQMAVAQETMAKKAMAKDAESQKGAQAAVAKALARAASAAKAAENTIEELAQREALAMKELEGEILTAPKEPTSDQSQSLA